MVLLTRKFIICLNGKFFPMITLVCLNEVTLPADGSDFRNCIDGGINVFDGVKRADA